MKATLSLIAGIAALVPALSFGQAPSIFELKDATKDAFEATSKALDTIEADRSKGKKATGAKKGSTASKTSVKRSNSSKASADQSNSSGGTTFSKLAERTNSPEAKKAANEKRLSAEEQETKFLSFLGSSSDMVYRVAFSIIGVAFAVCIGMRIKERVKDVATGRPSLSRSRIIRR